MSMLSIFCMNSINIYAGINGLEVGQSIIIGFFVMIHDLIELFRYFSLIIMIGFLRIQGSFSTTQSL